MLIDILGDNPVSTLIVVFILGVIVWWLLLLKAQGAKWVMMAWDEEIRERADNSPEFRDGYYDGYNNNLEKYRDVYPRNPLQKSYTSGYGWGVMTRNSEEAQFFERRRRRRRRRR